MASYRIALGADHAGVPLKDNLVEALRGEGHDAADLGPAALERVDYPDYAARVGRAVASGEADLGILVCGTGIGMSIAANKIRGVRAALVHDLFTARMAREHNDANILVLGGRLLASS